MATPGHQPPREPRDQALGEFMDAWSCLESQIFTLFHNLLGTDAAAAHVMFDPGIPIPTLCTQLQALAALRLGAKERRDVNALCEDLKTQAGTRNCLVHGHWVFRSEVRGGQLLNSPIWERAHDGKNKRFTIPAIEAATHALNALRLRFENFNNRGNNNSRGPTEPPQPQKR